MAHRLLEREEHIKTVGYHVVMDATMQVGDTETLELFDKFEQTHMAERDRFVQVNGLTVVAGVLGSDPFHKVADFVCSRTDGATLAINPTGSVPLIVVSLHCIDEYDDESYCVLNPANDFDHILYSDAYACDSWLWEATGQAYSVDLVWPLGFYEDFDEDRVRISPTQSMSRLAQPGVMERFDS